MPRKLTPEQLSVAADADLMVFRGRPKRPDAKRRLYTQALDGTDRERLNVDGIYPKLSADGRTIVFENFLRHRDRIYTVPARGGSPTELFDELGGDNHEPNFGPDGRIAFGHVGSNDAYPNGVYTANADGSDTQTLSEPQLVAGGYPSYSPDGERIVLVADRKQGRNGGGSPDIWVVGADGSSPTDLTVSSIFDAFPVFSPNGKQIAFLQQTGDPHVHTEYQLWVMNADGSDQELVLEGLSFAPFAWR